MHHITDLVIAFIHRKQQISAAVLEQTQSGRSDTRPSTDIFPKKDPSIHYFPIND